MQAALDLADSGIKVYLVEREPAIGGVMAKLDKTFPTNDCSMCILAPRLVGAGRHPNIEIITNAEVSKIDGDPGDFRVTVRKKARYVDERLCVGCGDCWAKCPAKKTPSEFDEGLAARTAIYRPYPQAIPNVPIIDASGCVYFKTGKCGVCAKVCKVNAIDYNMKDEDISIRAGAVVLSPGYELFQSSLKPELGYGRYPNVVTSLEFERILNASGPYSGKVLRPSDKRHPKKIALIQCVGSRDCDNNYCSSVCCMYATKEALIAMEHQPGLECTVFFIDMRAFGKGFDAYYERARKAGVRYVRCRPSSVKEIPATRGLDIRYEDESGRVLSEEFDMVVLSAGLRPPKEFGKMAGTFGIALNEHGFCRTDVLSPVESSRPGVYVCGPFTEPKDIPETVMQASAAASRALADVSAARGTLVESKTYPAEKDISGQEPRIGVFVCHCGTNIAGVINVPEVVEYAGSLAHVVYATDVVYACANDSLEKIKQAVERNNLNRVIVAACTPRTHEPLFRSTIREAGLNPYLFEMANIRDQGSWVHMHEPGNATRKAKDLLRMAVAKSRRLEPLEHRTMTVNPGALVIGGGMSGIRAALDMASHGVEVHLVETKIELGGSFRKLRFLPDGIDAQAKLAGLIEEVKNEKRITVHLNSRITAIEGMWGNFKTRVTVAGNGLSTEFSHGVIVVATGASEYKPTEYLYGRVRGVLTQMELEGDLVAGRLKAGTVVMIQCVGSRNEEHPYCSRVCCTQAVKNAVKIKEINPRTEVYVLYRDMRTYGFREQYYKKAREKGVVFLRYEDGVNPAVEAEGGKLRVSLTEPMLKKNVSIAADMVVLSTGMVSNPDSAELGQLLKIPLNQDKFFLEAHMKLRPVDFASDGIFLCGLAHSPKDSGECVAQAGGAAARASSVALSGTVDLDSNVSRVVESNCDGCAICVDTCPYKAITLAEVRRGGLLKKAVEVNPSVCKGCGVCQATCPKGGVSVQGFKLEQISAMVDSLLEVNSK